MNILMTADTLGGAWTYAVELARALAPHDVKVALATMGAPLSEAQKTQANAIVNLRIFESTFRLEWMENAWPDVEEAGQWLLQLERDLQPDVVHLNGFAHGAVSWRAPVLMVGHSCVLSWWRAVRGGAAPPEWNRYRREVGRGLQAADLVITPTAAMLQDLEDFYAPLPATRVVYNGREADSFRPGHKQNVVLAAGRLWDEAKNIGALEAVAGHLPWTVCVAGAERHSGGGNLRSSSVCALGWLDEVELADRMAHAAIYALPARYEPFGLSVLEAALAGCALVLGDIPSLREVWGECATFVPLDNSDALERTLRRLMENKSELRAAGHRARERAMYYTPQRMARGYLSAYQELLESVNVKACNV